MVFTKAEGCRDSDGGALGFHSLAWDLELGNAEATLESSELNVPRPSMRCEHGLFIQGTNAYHQ